MLYILVTTILPDNIVKLIPIKKGNYLEENEFVFEHKVQILVLQIYNFKSVYLKKRCNQLWFNNFKELLSILTGQQ